MENPIAPADLDRLEFGPFEIVTIQLERAVETAPPRGCSMTTSVIRAERQFSTRKQSLAIVARVSGRTSS